MELTEIESRGESCQQAPDIWTVRITRYVKQFKYFLVFDIINSMSQSLLARLDVCSKIPELMPTAWEKSLERAFLSSTLETPGHHKALYYRENFFFFSKEQESFSNTPQSIAFFALWCIQMCYQNFQSVSLFLYEHYEIYVPL